MGTIDVSITDIDDIRALASQWTQLESEVNPSYFLSWAWIGTWLALLPDTIKAKQLTARSNGEIIGLAILIQNTQSRRGLFPRSKVLLVNETGDPYYDLLTIEYNNFLIKQQYQPAATAACLDYLQEQLDSWDEIIIRAADANSPLTSPETIKDCGLKLKVKSDLPSWHINLQELREHGRTYLDTLSKNTRYQVRRAIRECEKHGDLVLSVANSVDEAQDYLLRLAEFHQAYWNARGKAGCFSNPFFTRFHQSLINNRFHHGEIQLIRIKAGEVELGYLYNFVSDGYLNFYQSGLNYEIGSKLKPGLIAHYKAIEHNMEQGLSIYDFLAGDDRYKCSLSTHNHRLLWISLQKNRVRFCMEDALNNFMRTCMNIIRRQHK